MGKVKSRNTAHSYLRAAERAGLSKTEAERLMKMASRNRRSIDMLPDGPIKEYLRKKRRAGKRIKYLEGYVFVFCKTSTKCLTMYPIDPEVVRAQILYENNYLIDYCPKCKRYFTFSVNYQTPGFRDTEDLRCPHCHYITRQSMEWEFYSRPIPEKI